jgi:hypothetical protein
MIRNAHLVLTSVIVVTLFVLLIYPAVIPVNAPPALKTFKDLFCSLAVLAIALAGVFVIRMQFSADFVRQPVVVDEELCTLHCLHRC